MIEWLLAEAWALSIAVSLIMWTCYVAKRAAMWKEGQEAWRTEAIAAQYNQQLAAMEAFHRKDLVAMQGQYSQHLVAMQAQHNQKLLDLTALYRLRLIEYLGQHVIEEVEEIKIQILREDMARQRIAWQALEEEEPEDLQYIH